MASGRQGCAPIAISQSFLTVLHGTVWALPQTHPPLQSFNAIPCIMVVGFWGYKNWQASGYMLLRSKVCPFRTVAAACLLVRCATRLNLVLVDWLIGCWWHRMCHGEAGAASFQSAAPKFYAGMPGSWDRWL